MHVDDYDTDLGVEELEECRRSGVGMRISRDGKLWRGLRDLEHAEMALIAIHGFALASRGQFPVLNGDELVENVVQSLLLHCSDPESVSSSFVRKCLDTLEQVGRSFRLLESIPCILNAFKKLDRFSTEDSPAIGILCSLRNILALEGPDSYFAFGDVPLQSTLSSTQLTSKGYSFNLWVRLRQGNQGTFNFFSLLTDEGSGVLMYLTDNRLEARMPHFQDRKQFIFDYDLDYSCWTMLAFVHSPQAKTKKLGQDSLGKMIMFVNGSPKATISLPYPDFSSQASLIQHALTVGGFQGDMGAFHLFGICLSLKQIRSIYASGCSFSPSFLSKSGHSIARFVPIHELTSGYIPGTCLRISPRNFHENVIVPDAWASNQQDKSSIEFTHLMQDTEIVELANNKKILFTRGGVKCILFACSPQKKMKGRPFTSSFEVSALLELISELIVDNPANLHQLSEVGVLCLKHYILLEVPPRMRDQTLLKGIERFLSTLETILLIPTVSPQVFVDAFRSFLFDFRYWKKQDVIKEVVRLASTIALRNSSLPSFKKFIDCTFFLQQIRYCCKTSFLSFQDDSSQVLILPSEDMDTAVSVIDCISSLLTESEDLDETFLEELICAMEDCRDSALLSHFFTLFLSLMKTFHTTIVKFLLEDKPLKIFQNKSARVLYQIFFDHLSASDADTRLCCLKVLAVLVRQFPKRKRSQFAAQVATAIKMKMLAFPLCQDICETLFDLSLDCVNLQLRASSFLDESVLVHPHFLFAALYLAKSVTTSVTVKEKVLLECLTLLKTNDENVILFAKENLWQNYIIGFLENSSEDSDVVHELVVQCLHTVLWSCISNEETGWLALDQILWCLSHVPGNMYAIKILIALQIVSKLSRLDAGNHISRNSLNVSNFKMTFLLIEQWLFCSPDAFFNSGRDPTTNELLLYERFLYAVMLLMPFENRRLQMLRTAYRYVTKLLKIDICFTHLSSHIFSCCRTVFVETLSEDNHDSSNGEINQAVRVLLYLLKDVLEEFLREEDEEKAALIKEMIIQVYSHWGSFIFQGVSGDEPTPVSALSPRDSANSSENLKDSVEIGQDAQEDTWDHVESKADVELSLEEDALLTLYQSESTDSALLWYAEMLRRFDEGMLNRFRKVNEKMQAYDETLMKKRRNSEESVFLMYFSQSKSRESFLERWAHLLSKESPNSMFAKETESLYKSSKILKDFATDFQSRPFPYTFDELNLEVPELEPNSYFKLDRCETPIRQRYLLRRNLAGHQHEQATTIHPCDIQRPSIALEEAIPLDLPQLKVPLEECEENKDEVPDPRLLGVGDDFDDKEEEMDDEIERHDQTIDFGDSSEKMISFSVTLVAPLLKVKGSLNISSKSVSFNGEEFSDVTHLEEKEEQSYNGVPGLKKLKRLKFSLTQIRQILPRRYLLQECAVELFLKTRLNYFFTFDKTAHRNDAFKLLCDLLKLPAELNNRRRVQYSGVTEKWRKGKLSNFEYLMHLNTFAGRSYNDINQYPVFPWIISDYRSESIDLSDPSVYRDLTKPMGALNPKRAQIYMEKYADASGVDSMPPWHYGSHYSNAGILLHYLLRLEPFTTLAVQIQGGKFDLPDRLFHSMASAWDLSYNNISDVKELIPEFFYSPEFLLNSNGLDLGRKQDKQLVGDVILPPWAESPHHFVEINRQALESEYVSKNLHHWIDLIFGYKQRGEEAVKALNVFFYLTYQGSVDIDSIQDESIKESTIAQISHFGQTPCQLFTSPHPARDVISPQPDFSLPFDLPVNYGPILIHQYPENAIGSIGDLCAVHGDEILHLTHDTSKSLSLYRFDISQMLMKVIRESKLSGGISTHPKPSVRPSQFSLNGPAASAAASAISSISNATFGSNPQRKASKIMSSEWQADSLALSANGKFIFLGGFGNFSAKCLLTRSLECVSSVIGHCDKITCINHGYDQSSLVTGSLDGTLTFWSMFARRYDHNHLPPLANGNNQIYPAHRDAVIDISHSLALGLIVSISKDGTCALCSINRKRYLKSHMFAKGILPQKVLLCESARIVVYATKDGKHVLLLYDINLRFLLEKHLDSSLNVLKKSVRDEFVIAGDATGVVTFFKPDFLTHVQEFDCCRLRLGPQSNKDAQDRMIAMSLSSLGSDVSTVSMNEDSEEEEPSENIIRSPVQSIDIDPRGSYFVVCLQDGRLLLYPLPKMLGLSEFQVLFEMLHPAFDIVKDNLYYQIHTPPGESIDSSDDVKSQETGTARSRVTSVLKTFGGSVRGFFQ